ncbi:MAG: peptide chain release factor N(5)-glutamine methyltransferase [Candidatus Dependentiae bacterium]|nr:peptide chain release factor N(5)-glutamine methyltransferase [Candidatus Dependentiae bacterium]
MEQKKITALIGRIKTSLRPVYHDATLREQSAWWIVEAITKKNHIELIAQNSFELTPEQEAQLAAWLDALINESMPLQYLIGSVPFVDLEIMVKPPVLIPRPETEEWVANLIGDLKRLENQSITILDACTGSGCVALALAHALPAAQVYAIDISAQALELAKANAQHNGIANITFMESDLFDAVPTDQLFDLIVSNPPYISFNEFEELYNSVTTWEDPQALVAEDEGYAILYELIEQAADFIELNAEMQQRGIPQVVLEIGYKQGHKVSDFMKSAGFNDVKVHKDLAGKDRTVTGRIDSVVDSKKTT